MDDLTRMILVLIGAAIFWGGIPIYLWSFKRRIRGRSLESEGTMVKILDSNRKVIAAIDVSRPFQAKYFWKGYLWAYYSVSQDRIKVQFSSESPGAEHVVRDLFKMQWPPVGSYPGL